MTTKRRGLVAGGLLAGALLLGTAGLVAAQDPTTSPTANPGWGGAGVMGGQMNGQMGAPGMMGGQMNGQMGAPGMMTPELFEQMDAIHDQMVASGGANHAQMEALHAQHHPTR